VRILVYGLNYAPELTGIGKYTGEMAAWLAQRGHQVRVVTAPPYYPEWRVHERYRRCFYRRERSSERGSEMSPACGSETSPARASEPGPTPPAVYRTPLWVPARPTGLSRLLHLFSFALGSFPVVLSQARWRPELVFAVEPTLFAAPIALLTAAVAGAPAWLHIQDFEVDAAFRLDLLARNGALHALAARLDGFVTRRFARVSTISRKMLERLHTRGIPEQRAVLFPNWADLDDIYPDPYRGFRRELGLEGKIILLYSGNMGAKQGLEVLAPLVAFFASDPEFKGTVHFLLCGGGAFRPQLEALLAHHSNVTLLPLQPKERLHDLLNTADIHLLPQRRGVADLVMPSKLTGMLASGRPILATADPGTQVAHVVEGCGLVVAPEDPAALQAAARRLIADPSLRARLGVAARSYATQYLGKEQLLLCFEQELLALVGRSPVPVRTSRVLPTYFGSNEV